MFNFNAKQYENDINLCTPKFNFKDFLDSLKKVDETNNLYDIDETNNLYDIIGFTDCKPEVSK